MYKYVMLDDCFSFVFNLCDGTFLVPPFYMSATIIDLMYIYCAYIHVLVVSLADDPLVAYEEQLAVRRGLTEVDFENV